jgi:hypothetical protein
MACVEASPSATAPTARSGSPLPGPRSRWSPSSSVPIQKGRYERAIDHGTRVAQCGVAQATKDCSSSAVGRGISVAGTPERGAVIQKAREVVELARRHGYRTDELVQIIRDVD